MDIERHLIERIKRALPSETGESLRLGIGDDAAIIGLRPGKDLVVTCDAFIEGVHFWADVHPPESAGYKSLARAASDLAAMGARPRFFLFTLAIPQQRTGRWLGGFLRGMARAAREMGANVAGGDTTKNAKIVISITVAGDIARGRAIRRDGARPGDLVYVSGKLGKAQLGLNLLRHPANRKLQTPRLLSAHLYPKIPFRLGAWLASHKVPSAMIDISDGLSTDISRLCEASGVGARIFEERLPVPEVPAEVSRVLERAKSDPLNLAGGGGDDYELLGTVSPMVARRVNAAPGRTGRIMAAR